MLGAVELPLHTTQTYTVNGLTIIFVNINALTEVSRYQHIYLLYAWISLNEEFTWIFQDALGSTPSGLQSSL